MENHASSPPMFMTPSGNNHAKTMDHLVQLHGSVALWAMKCPGLMGIINNTCRPTDPAQEVNHQPQHFSQHSAGQPVSPRWQLSPGETSTAANTFSSTKEQSPGTTKQLPSRQPSRQLCAQQTTQLCSAGGVWDNAPGKPAHAAVYQGANLGKSPPNNAKSDGRSIRTHASQSADTAEYILLGVYESFSLTADVRNPAAVLQEGWDVLNCITQQQQLAVTSLDLSAVRKAAANIAAQQT